MKILYHHRIRSNDGQYVHVSEIVNALIQDGYVVEIVGPRIVEESAGSDGAGWVANLKRALPKPVYEFIEAAYSLLDFFALAKAIRSSRPDFIYERYNLFLLSGIWAKSLFRLPLILEVNAPLVQERAKYGGIGLRAFAEWAEGYVWRRADAVLPVTEVLADIARDRGVHEDRLTVIRNGVNLSQFSLKEPEEAEVTCAAGKKQITLGFVGYLRDWHRLDRVVSLLARAGNEHLRFLVVGDGPARDELASLAERKGVSDRVVFIGVVDRDELPGMIARFDIALQPSVVDYASPLKLAEYLVLGCAVVAPDKRNIREVLTHMENGILFDSQDDKAFERSVELLCEDEALRKRIGNSARRTIRELGLTWTENAQEIVKIAHDRIADTN